MKKRMNTKTMVLVAMFLALAIVLPFLTGQIPQIGSMLCPMHIPVLLCGFFCGGPLGFVVGIIAPLLRSILFGMPVMFPKAVCMAFELGAYGMVTGVMHQLLPKKKWMVYISLIIAMLAGRIVWGIAMFACVGFDTGAFGLSAFLAGALTNAIPGIVLQLVLIPILVVTLEKYVYRQEV